MAILVCACATLSPRNVTKCFMLQKIKTLLANKKKILVIHSIKRIITKISTYLFHHSNSIFTQILSRISLEMFWNVMEKRHAKSATSVGIRSQAQFWLSECLALLWRGMAVSKITVKLGKNTGSVLSQCNTKYWEWKENLLLSILRLVLAILFQKCELTTKRNEKKNLFFQVSSQCLKNRTCHAKKILSEL